jgi:hypothetical protein
LNVISFAVISFPPSLSGAAPSIAMRTVELPVR